MSKEETAMITHNNTNNQAQPSNKLYKTLKQVNIFLLILSLLIVAGKLSMTTVRTSSYKINGVVKSRMERPWVPININDLNYTSNKNNRSPELYLKVLRQFDVANNVRYEKRVIASINGRQLEIPYSEWVFMKNNLKSANKFKYIRTNTYCNIYMWDVTKAMGVEIPHYMKQNSNTVELNANMIAQWLNSSGERYGWKEVGFNEAIARANQGYPTVLAAYRPGKIGHVAMVSPNVSGDINTMYVAEAGGTNSDYAKVNLDWYERSGYIVKFYTND